MPGNPGIFPGAAALMPQQRERTESDWSPRDYWVQPPTRIPPNPPFEAWVPLGDTIAFGEAPRDLTNYQLQQQTRLLPKTQVLPAPPPTVGVNLPQQNARPDWTLKEYNANRDVFSAIATPLLPPPNNQLPPQHNARPDWTFRDYNAYQAMSAWFENNPTANVIPPQDLIVIEYLPPDQAALQLAIRTSFTLGPAAVVVPPKPHVPDPQINPVPYDYTAQQFSIVKTPQGVLAGIPQVPVGVPFPAFAYLPPDLTAIRVATTTYAIPQPLRPQIPPAAPTYLEPPPWTLRDYVANQDQFSALGTPTQHAYPPGLLPQFTPEALIRDVSHPTTLQLVQTFLLPPPPPRVFPNPPTFLEWRQWAANEYPSYQDGFSALASGFPVLTGFRVMAVTAGYYGGYFYNPGDVFDIAFASQFSDASVNYQAGGNEYATGWMVKVPSTTPLSQAAVLQSGYIIPDPKRRFVM